MGIVAGLAYAAFTLNNPLVWPLYWIAQGTMFWALFVVGHDCGHQSFSPSRTLNDFVGNIVHASILVPYHGWRVSHRKHHGNHGHVENDESWYPTTKSLYDKMEEFTKLGRLRFPWALFAYPFYLWKRSPGKVGAPQCGVVCGVCVCCGSLVCCSGCAPGGEGRGQQQPTRPRRQRCLQRRANYTK